LIGVLFIIYHDKQFAKVTCSCLHLNKPFGGLNS